MPDLYVQDAVLAELRSRLAGLCGRLEGACGGLRQVDAAGMGAVPLIERLDDFANEWNYGIGQIGKRTDGAVNALVQIGRTFDEVERVLAEACRPPEAQ